MTQIVFLTALLWKHAFADLFLQTFHCGVNKTKYFGNSQRHYIEHGVLTFLVSVFFCAWYLALFVAFLDYIIHWQIDYFKSSVVKKFNIDRQSTVFWRLQSLDQFLHYTTYGMIVYIIWMWQ